MGHEPYRRAVARVRGGVGTLLCALVLLAGCAATLPTMKAATGTSADAVADILRSADAGEFAAADVAIESALARADLTPEQRVTLEFERERMRRIRMDFSLDRDAALARVQRIAPAIDAARFDAFDAQGLLESMRIDGSTHWFNRAPSNLFRLSAEARALRADPDAPFRDGPYERLQPHHAAVLAATRQQVRRFVLPQRVRITQSLDVNADAVPAGETVRAWIPYPRAIPGQQSNIQFIASEPTNPRIAPEATLQRTVYLERPATAGTPTRFSITYELDIAAQHLDLDAAKVVPTPLDPTLAPYLAEEPPHIVFSDDIRAFSARVVGEETHPLRVARKLFAAVDAIPWAGAREYSTLRNISDYALHAGHADCGQQTLLLITLLRLNGIPARWQSGWTFSTAADDYANLHDWGWLFLAPYGWVPMDVTTGLLDSDDAGLREFYLGGLDGYRIAFNDAIATPFDPAKQFFRSETVDSQRGEAEWRGGNLYFDQWDYGFSATILPAASSTPGDPP